MQLNNFFRGHINVFGISIDGFMKLKWKIINTTTKIYLWPTSASEICIKYFSSHNLLVARHTTAHYD